ncbi:arginase family protein [Kocuria sp. M1R5S2]|uniref:arginase family protein n=1 Tax=Kocuria rhizosphaerae TaxID=3376285 RepID=UPI00379DD244
MADVELIGVPFDGYGRAGHQAVAAQVLREAGLDRAWSGHTVVDGGDVALPAPDPGRGELTTLMNESALAAMAVSLGSRVAGAVRAGRFPCVVGGDCAVLLGIVPALQADGGMGLLHVDGHEDTMPLERSEDGEAANAEIGLLLGLTGRGLRGPLAERIPALDGRELAVLGPRDHEWRRRFGVGSLAQRGVSLWDVQEVAAAPGDCARAAVRQLRSVHGRWWLHVDLDVLDPDALPAQGLPDIEDEPGGLTWPQLTRALTAAVSLGGCAGTSLAVYDPDQDDDRSQARRIVRLVADLAAALPGG